MNIIVIVLDSCRVDHLGCYGSPVRTPNIDALAAESAVLEQAYSENMPTMPCRAAWWLGRYLFPSRGWQPFEHGDLLLAEFLSGRGYASALVTDTYHMHRPAYNCGRGFDTTVFVRGQEYDPWIVDPGVPVDLDRHHRLRGDTTDDTWRPRFEQYLRNASTFTTEDDHCAPRVFKEAVRWLEHASTRQKDRLFLWVDSFSPHEPWDPPEPYRSMYDPGYTGHEIIDPVPGVIEGYLSPEEVTHTRSLYAGCVTLADKWIGVLLDRVRSLGLYDNSLVMVTSDHGEPFGEHGIIRKAGRACHEELAHIPWIVRHPDGIGAGRRFRGFAQPPDLLPTVLESVGIDPGDTGAGWAFAQVEPLVTSGTSLVPMLRGDVDTVRDIAVSGYSRKQWSIRTDQWSYLHPLDGEPGELYDRREDLAEQHNLIDTRREVADSLELRLHRFADEVARPAGIG